MSNYLKTRGILNLSGKVYRGGNNRQANFNSQQSLTPALIEQNSSNSAIQKLAMLATKLRDDCFCQQKCSQEIAHDFIIPDMCEKVIAVMSSGDLLEDAAKPSLFLFTDNKHDISKNIQFAVERT